MMSTPIYISINLNDNFFVNNPIYNNDIENNIIEEEKEEELPECRICLESHGNLISVCACKGTCEFVHEECIVEWIQQFPEEHEKYKNCEICKSEYNLVLVDLKNKYCTKKEKIVSAILCYAIVLFTSFMVLVVLWF